MSIRRLHIAQTDELTQERITELIALCEAAFKEPFAALWERVGPGVHVVAEVDGTPVAHAMVVDRALYFGGGQGVQIDAGYVEHVATRPDARHAGHATAVMREVGRIIDEEYEIGALATGSRAFYEPLGWELWRGPTFVRSQDGEWLRSSDSDGHVMVLRTSRTPADLDVASPIAVDWRPGEPW
jgi:aminoglycoside 2'-N-acetyltransferase I